MTPRDNDRLTRVTGDAPMGRLMRENFWMPFARSEAFEPGGAPQRVRLLGIDMVAFRGEDGTMGLMDEFCPHRRASMVLARVEGCTLRCIYHGWRLDASGKVVEVPSEGDRSELFASHVKTSRRIAREGGGLIWAWLGENDPPPLPELPFMQVAPEARYWVRLTSNYNWLQDLEGLQDSVHLGWLHKAFHAAGGQELHDDAPIYEIAETAYGLRTAALRKAGAEGVEHRRVAEFIAPFYTLSPGRQPHFPSDNAGFIVVPIDDEKHLLFFCFWDESGKLNDLSALFLPDTDPDNALNHAHYNRGNTWGQDREAMKNGHFSGIGASLVHEDVAVQESMGPIVDRSKETLCSSDLAVVRTRAYLLGMLAKQDAGEPIDGALDGYTREGCLPYSTIGPKVGDWRDGGQRKVREEA